MLSKKEWWLGLVSKDTIHTMLTEEEVTDILDSVRNYIVIYDNRFDPPKKCYVRPRDIVTISET